MTAPPARRTEIIVPVRTIVLLGAVFLVGWALVSVRSALLIVFTGAFLGLVFEFPVRAVERRFHLGRGLAATLVVVGALVAAVLLGLILLAPMVTSVMDFLKALPQTVQDLRDSGTLSWAGDSDAARSTQDGANDIAQAIPDTVSAALGVAGDAFSALIVISTIVFAALFFLTDVGDLKRGLGSVLMPAEEERWLGAWERITETVSRWAVGVIVIACIAGTVQGVTAWLLGSSFALALGIIAGLLDMIPNIGATIAGFLLGLTLLAEEGVTQAIVMVVVVLVYQQIENNIITPTVQGKATSLSAFFIISGVTVFGALLGVLGALVAVPITATIQLLATEVTAMRRAAVAAAKAAAAPSAPVSAPADPGS